MTEQGLSPELDQAVAWPALPLAEWRDTQATLHMWTQIVGKIRLVLSAPINHWWHSALYVTARGLATSLIPYKGFGFEIEFDFVDHRLVIRDSRGGFKRLALAPRTVANFYSELMAVLEELGIQVKIRAIPDEVSAPIPFAEDDRHSSYDPEYAGRFWRALQTVDTVFKAFRGRFIGKSSPVHFFWGGFDLAVTRFSGRRAPERSGANAMMREAESHENISAGFWPLGGAVDGPVFYAYTVPEPAGLRDRPIVPAEAFYNREMGEFLLRYDDVRRSPSPTSVLLDFLQSTYAAGADLAGWDRAALERPLVTGSVEPSVSPVLH